MNPQTDTAPPVSKLVNLPTVDGQSGQLDVVSRFAPKILLLGTDVNDEVANVLVAQLLYLANEDPNRTLLCTCSPGGSVSAGLAIYDIIQFIPVTSNVCDWNGCQ
jgi:ATP-dependent Clp endopeptidase proteolytic subunit ClpP